MSKKILLVLPMVFILVLTACGGGEAAKPSSVKIAVSAPEAIEFGGIMKATIEMALADAGGQANGIDIEMLYINSSDPEGNPVSPEKEAEAAALAVADEDVLIYIGPISSDQAKLSIPILNEAGIAQISPTSTWPGLTKPGFGPGEPGIYYPTGQRNFFRMVPSDDIQGVAAANWADGLGYAKVSIVDDGSVFGAGVAGIFEIQAQDIGLEIVTHESYDPYNSEVSQNEYNALAKAALANEPDLVYYGGAMIPGGTQFVSALHTLNPDAIVMGPDGLVQDQLVSDLGDLANNTLGTTVAVPPTILDNPAAAEFVTKFESQFDMPPGPYLANIYESMKLALYALENTETYTREGVLETLSNMDEFNGVLGTWHFSPEGDISITTIGGMEVRDGAWQFVETLK
jgi:branched-chain amino acid transport system substrate-binding protein